MDKVKTKTLIKISDAFQIHNNNNKLKPTTVLWSGSGYHCCMPVDSHGNDLEQMSKSKKVIIKELSKEFLRFAEWYLSTGKCDNEHNKTVSFNNCMLRIPGSFNSKNSVQVRVVQKWDGTFKVSTHLLYDKFFAYIVDQGQKNLITKHTSRTRAFSSENDGSLASRSVLQRYYQRRNKNKKEFISWIERLLEKPVPDYRKYCIWRIFAPYLVNVKRLPFEEAFDIIDNWLSKCNDLKPLDFDTETKINCCLNNALDIGYQLV